MLIPLMLSAALMGDPYGSIADLKVAKPEDKVDAASTPPPGDAIVLFDGKTLD